VTAIIEFNIYNNYVYLSTHTHVQRTKCQNNNLSVERVPVSQWAGMVSGWCKCVGKYASNQPNRVHYRYHVNIV